MTHKIIIAGILLMAGFLFVKNLYFLTVPNSDVFQIREDAFVYKNFQLPSSIHAPPLLPVISSVLMRHLTFVPEYDIRTPVIINIISAIGCLLVLWLIVKRETNPWWAHLFLLLVITNPQFIVSALDAPPDMLFAFLVLLSLYWIRNRVWAALCMVLAVFARYEALGLIGLWFLVDSLKTVYALYNKRSKKKERTFKVWWQRVPKMFLVALGISLCGLIAIFIHNSSNYVPYGNMYVSEIVSRSGDLPEWRVFYQLPKLMLLDIDTACSRCPNNFKTIITFFLFVAAFSLLLDVKGTSLPTYILFAFVYMVTHALFPAYQQRYLLVVILIGYLSFFITLEMVARLCKGKARLFFYGLLFVVTLATAVNNYRQSEAYAVVFRQTAAHYKYMADWLNNQTFSEQVAVLSPEPWMLSYFLHKEHVVSYHDYTYVEQRCSSINCAITNLGFKQRVLVMREGSVFLGEDTALTVIEKILNHQDENRCLSLLTETSNDREWAKMYEYDFVKCPRGMYFQ
jgi:hypothetical protein